MDWHEILDGAAAPGTTFWVAVAAIALGLTLLVTALAVQLRRQLAARARRPLPGKATPGIAPPRAAAGPAARPVPRSAPPEDASLALLLRRLQIAGDRLEQLSEGLVDDAAITGESFLKPAGAEVEYVFKA